jgi:hypothetical protein
MIWSLLEAEGSGMSSFLQGYLLKHCEEVIEESKLQKGHNGCVRFVNIDRLRFETMVKALRTQTFDISSQQTVFESPASEKGCTAIECTHSE